MVALIHYRSPLGGTSYMDPPAIWPLPAASLALLFFSFLDSGFCSAASGSITSATAAAAAGAVTCRASPVCQKLPSVKLSLIYLPRDVMPD